MHLLKAERPGQSTLRLGFAGDTDEAARRCKEWLVEVRVDLSAARTLLSQWAMQENQRSAWSAPRLELSAQGALILLEGEVAQPDHRQALEALLGKWLEAQALPGLSLVNWLHVRPAEQIMLEVRIANRAGQHSARIATDHKTTGLTPCSTRDSSPAS